MNLLILWLFFVAHPTYPPFPKDTLWPDRVITSSRPPFSITPPPIKPQFQIFVQPWQSKGAGISIRSDKIDFKAIYQRGRDFCDFDTADFRFHFADEQLGLEIESNARGWFRNNIKYESADFRFQLFEFTEESTFAYLTVKAKHKRVWDSVNVFKETIGDVRAGILFSPHERVLSNLEFGGLYAFDQKLGIGKAQFILRWLPTDKLLLVSGFEVNPNYRPLSLGFQFEIQCHPMPSFVFFGHYSTKSHVPESPEVDFVRPISLQGTASRGYTKTKKGGVSFRMGQVFSFKVLAESKTGVNTTIVLGDSIPHYGLSESFSLRRAEFELSRNGKILTFGIKGYYVFLNEGLYYIPKYQVRANIGFRMGPLAARTSSILLGERKPSESSEIIEPYRIDDMVLSISLPYNFEAKFLVNNLLDISPEVYRGWRHAGRHYEIQIIWRK